MATPNNNRISVRREQVQGEDPLFDAMRAQSSSPIPNTTNEFSQYKTPPPAPLTSAAPPNSIAGSQNVTPVPPYPHRYSVIVDSVETQADNILKNCVLPIERQKGILLKAVDVPPTLEGLQQLRRCCSWQDVFKLSLQLTAESQVQTLSDSERHAILCVRFESLFRTKLFDDLQSELTKEIGTLGSKEMDDTERDRLIAYKLLLSEARLMSGQGVAALESLLGLSHSLTNSSQAISKSDGTAEEKRRVWKAFFWRIITQCQIVNAQLRLRQWRRALNELRKLEAEINHAADSAVVEQEKADLCFAKVIVCTRLIRLLLQMGDKNSAKTQLECIAQSLAQFPSLTGDVYLQQTLMSSQGLLSFAEDNYESAAEIFSHLLETEKSREQYNSHFSTWSAPTPETLTVGMAFKRALCEAKDEGMLSSAVNNLSLSLLHLKQNRVAMEKLEQLIGLDPPSYMSDAVVFNLCTLYDLSYSPEVSQQKKKVLQRIALRFGLIDPVLHWRSFRAN